MPKAHGNLAGDQQGAASVAILNDFQKVAPVLDGQWLVAEVIDQQVGPAEAGEQLGVAAVAAGQVEGGEESGAR